MIMLVGIALLPTGEVVRLASGWPRNPNCYPMVVGPGDKTRLYLPNKIESVKGLWNGRSTATVVNAEELGLTNPQLDCSSNDKTWGVFIGGKGSWGTSTSQLWSDVKAPSDENIAGKTLQVRIKMDVKFPAKHGLLRFEDEERPYEDVFELQIATPLAGRTYRNLWWGGGLGGGILVLVGSALLLIRARKTKKAALPSKAIPLEDEDAGPVDEVLPAEDGDEPPQVLPAD
jgi:hypothetical protein